MLAALSAIPGAALFVTPKVLLYTAGPAITPDADPSAFTEATFTGYAKQAVTLAGPVLISPGVVGMVAQVRFICTAVTAGTSVCIGMLVTNGTTAFYSGEPFGSNFNIGAPGDFLDIDLILPLQLVLSPPVA